MKSLKKLLIIFLALSTLLFLFACGECEEHKDDNKDGKCDNCGETVTAQECTHKDEDEDGKCDDCGETLEEVKELVILKGTDFNFQIVQGGDVKVGTVKLLDNLVKTLADFSIDAEVVRDEADNIMDYEILIGTVESRGDEYMFDKYTLGPKGYMIKMIDNKILVTAGSDDALVEVVTMFIEDILGITEDTETLKTVKFTSKDEVTKIFDDYEVESIKVGGNEIWDYNIVVDAQHGTALSVMRTAATKLQKYIYESTGHYLDIINAANVTPDMAGGIYIREVGRGDAGATGFRAKVEGNDYIVECAHYNKFDEAFQAFYENVFEYALSDTINLTTYSSKVDITVVTYEEFGAIGDGKTDDYQAIFDAHKFANEGGQTVRADGSKTYLLKNIKTTITIKTSTDWCGAKIIIDDTSVTPSKDNPFYKPDKHIASTGAFGIVSDYANGSVDQEYIDAINAKVDEDGLVLRGLESGNPTTKLDFALGYPAILRITNSNHQNYIRYGGYVDSTGRNQAEIILVDAEGNIDPSTPLLHDFTCVTSISIHRVDVEEITVGNATIESIASRINLEGQYFTNGRSINISRPNVTIQGIKHVITGEIPKDTPVAYDEATGLSYIPEAGYAGTTKPFIGHSYSGIISVDSTHNTLVKNCVFQSRVWYREGTYDISASYTNKLEFNNCTQSNFFEEGSNVPNTSICWGVAGTNYCKNMDFIDCKLTRYDAHASVTNGKISGGEIAIIRLIGGGDFIIEDVKIWPRNNTVAPIQLREDYGASFNGTVTIKNVTIATAWGKPISSLISAPASCWDMGYKTFFPNIIVDNLTIEGTKGKSDVVNLVAMSSTGTDNAYRDFLRVDASNPNSPFRMTYKTTDAEAYIAKHITAEDGKFYGCTYQIKEGTSYDTLIITSKTNILPYIPPELIEVKNCENKTYTLQLYNSAFFRNTTIKAESGNIKKVAVPK